MTATPVAIWDISESDFLAFRRLLKSADYFSDTYDDWLDKVEGFYEEMRFRGVRPRKVKIEFDRFSDWCSSKQLKPDTKAFKRYIRHAHLLGHAPIK